MSPETDHVVIAGVRVARGSRVTHAAGQPRRADAQDLFLAGREATVQAVLHDVDGDVHLAVSPDRTTRPPTCSAATAGSCTSAPTN